MSQAADERTGEAAQERRGGAPLRQVDAAAAVLLSQQAIETAARALVR